MCASTPYTNSGCMANLHSDHILCLSYAYVILHNACTQSLPCAGLQVVHCIILVNIYAHAQSGKNLVQTSELCAHVQQQRAITIGTGCLAHVLIGAGSNKLCA